MKCSNKQWKTKCDIQIVEHWRLNSEPQETNNHLEAFSSLHCVEPSSGSLFIEEMSYLVYEISLTNHLDQIKSQSNETMELNI